MTSIAKPTKKNPPFYFYEGKGWKIETKVKIGGEFRKLNKGWYRSLSEAKSDYSAQVDALTRKHTAAEPPRPDIKWEEFSARFLDMRRTKVRGSTMNHDKLVLKTLFDPLFRHMKVKDVYKRDMAEKFQAKVRKHKCNRKNKNKALSYYLAMLEFAYEREYLEQDADYRRCKSEITMISSTEEEEQVNQRTALTSEQCDALIEAISDTKDRMLTALLSETGLRIGEALVIRHADFDFRANILSITRTLSEDEFGQWKEYNRTKTKLGIRKIPISPQFCLVVQSYCQAFGFDGDDLLFPSEEDRQKNMDGSAYRRRLAKYCESANLPKISPHCLRHSFCTRISQRCFTDADRIARSYIMGHSVAVDEAVYAAHNQLDVAKTLIGEKK